MTEKEYRSHPAISRSELWKISESPLKFKYYKDNPPPPTPSLVFGQILHKLVLQPESFAEEFDVIPEVDRRTKEGKQKYDEFIGNLGERTAITPDEFVKATEMSQAIMAEPLAKKLLSGGEKEKVFFWNDDLTGEQCKCRVDCINTSFSQPIIVDIKTTGDASSEGFMKSAINYGYDFQSAMYTDGVKHNISQQPIFVFIAVEKEPPYAVNIFRADEIFMRRGYDLFREYIGIYHDCRMTGNWYGYMGKYEIINNLSLPLWLAKEYE